MVLDDGAPVGLACVGTAARPEGVAPAEDGASDVWLAVLPTRRAAGVATRACDLLVETLRLGGHTRLRATVPMDDVAAGRLAVRCGCSRRADVVADDGRACAVYELEVLV